MNMILFYNTVSLDWLTASGYTKTHTRTHMRFWFGNYLLPLLTAESFLHLDKAMEGSKEIKGKGVVIASLPFISLCTLRAVQLHKCQIRAPKCSGELIQTKKIHFFWEFFWVICFSAWFTVQLYNGRAYGWEDMTVNSLCHKNKCSSKCGLSRFIIQASKLVHYIGCAVLKLWKKSLSP